MIESKYLQDSVQNIQQLFAIPSLRRFETRNLGKLVRISKVRRYDDGECIINEGDTDLWLYFLLSGAVRIEKDGSVLAKLEKIGDVFGEMRLLDSLSRSASVYAVGPTVCLAVNTSASDRMPSDDETTNFLLLLYRAFAEFISIRLRLTTDELVATRKELEALKAQKG